MKASEIRELSLEELVSRERELRGKLFDLKVRHQTAIVDSTAELKALRREIARVKTVQREKAMAAARGSA
jgi:large subunit ribosomal protein L29